MYTQKAYKITEETAALVILHILTKEFIYGSEV
jgi:hypothetical protein